MGEMGDVISNVSTPTTQWTEAQTMWIYGAVEQWSSVAPHLAGAAPQNTRWGPTAAPRPNTAAGFLCPYLRDFAGLPVCGVTENWRSYWATVRPGGKYEGTRTEGIYWWQGGPQSPPHGHTSTPR